MATHSWDRAIPGRVAVQVSAGLSREETIALLVQLGLLGEQCICLVGGTVEDHIYLFHVPVREERQWAARFEEQEGVVLAHQQVVKFYPRSASEMEQRFLGA